MTPEASSAHAFVDDLDEPALSSDDRHHLERVLRVRPGSELTVSNGQGGWRSVRFAADLEPTGPIERRPSPRPAVTVAFALVKGDKPDWVVQKLTEVGVDRIVVFPAERSIARWDDDKVARQLRRQGSVIRQAAMQSRRVWLPDVVWMTGFDQVIALPGAVLADAGGAPPALPTDAEQRVILVGPEGGWSNEERSAAVALGVPSVMLGPHVLRAETASVTAGALYVALRMGIVVRMA